MNGFSSYRVSVIIKTYDDTENSNRGLDHKQPFATLRTYLEKTLCALGNQEFRPFEVIVVDSSVGSGIADVVKNYQASTTDGIIVRTVPLTSKEFSHPKALNLGIREATGDIIVSLSGDATPANSAWLKNLISRLTKENVGGAYSRQRERPGVPVSFLEKFRLNWRYPAHLGLRHKDPVFSNASSAFWQHLALENPFNEKLLELEDFDWKLRVEDKGWKIEYANDSDVFHSHNSSAWWTFHRMVYYFFGRIWIRISFLCAKAFSKTRKKQKLTS